MSKMIYGRLQDVYEELRVVTMKRSSKIDFYYMPKGLFQTFLSYFIEGSYIFMTVSDQTRIYKGWKTYSVESIEKILYPRRQNPLVFYDISIIKSQIRKLLETDRPKLFLDLEMTMPPYRLYETFESEIIQYGYVLTDARSQILEQKKSFVKPTKIAEISDRTKKFLKVSQADVDQGIPAQEFFRSLQSIFRTYRPMVLVWGQNDIIELKKGARINHIADITKGVQIVDLLRLHKTFFALKNDLGLFNAYTMYFGSDDQEKQAHDALEDAMVTKLIFDWFKEVASGQRKVDTSEYK
ncbi:MAG: exonuclease domain-containing protein [Bacillus subtilis]|nr:exonuclease domain-containing protein [Bacillus subtilis]